jgi:hypothetical protein
VAGAASAAGAAIIAAITTIAIRRDLMLPSTHMLAG